MRKKRDVSFKEAVRLNVRTFLIWWRCCPSVFCASCACALAKGLSPYAEIYLTARLLDEIAGGKNPHTLMLLTLALLILRLYSVAALRRA